MYRSYRIADRPARAGEPWDCCDLELMDGANVLRTMRGLAGRAAAEEIGEEWLEGDPTCQDVPTIKLERLTLEECEQVDREISGEE